MPLDVVPNMFILGVPFCKGLGGHNRMGADQEAAEHGVRRQALAPHGLEDHRGLRLLRL